MIKKNVSGQKLAFLMVDATDFATPEAGKSVTAKYSKNGGGLSTCSNTVSAVTSGLYVITLAATETNADVCAYQFLNASCADQWIIVYPETITSIVSNVLSTLDDNVANKLTSILADTGTTLENRTTSILADTAGLGTIGNNISSILEDTDSILYNRQTSILGYCNSLLQYTSDAVDILTNSVLVDTQYLIDYCCGTVDSSGVTSMLALLKDSGFGLDALETIASDILSTLDDNVANKLTSILTDTNTISNLGAGDDSHILSTLDQYFPSILADTQDISNLGGGIQSQILSTIDSIMAGTLTSILEDTQEISNIAGAADTSGVTSALALLKHGTYGLDALETLISDVLSTLDDNVASELTAIKSDVAAVYSSLSDCEATLISDIAAVYSALSDCEATLISDVAAVKSSVSDTLAMVTGNSNIISQILVDTGTTLDNKLDSILVYTNSDITEMAAGAPPASPTPREVMNYLYRVFRNKIETDSAVQKVYNDAGNSVLFSCAVTDDGSIFTKGEHA